MDRKTLAPRRIAVVLLSAMVLACASCAYYNTFFLAKKHYKQAERFRSERPDDQPTSSEIASYEKCIKQCSKVIAEYPNSKYVDDALFLMGKSYYYWERYDDAMKWFGRLQEIYPQSVHIREARFLTARSHLALREYVEAENILTQLLSSPGGEELEKERIMFALSEVAVKRGYSDAAVAYLRALLAGEPPDRLKLEANLALGDVYFERGAYDSAAMSYEIVSTRSGKKEQRVEARKRMGQSYQARGDCREALDIYSQLLLSVEKESRDNRKKDPQEAALLLRMGECHNSLGEHERALELFRRVMEDFPMSSVAAEAEFLTGYTYEMYYEDLERAKISYDRVPTHFQRSVYVDDAKKRSAGLAQLQQYSGVKGERPEEAEAEGLFLSAELNLFQLNKPEKALELYREVESTYSDDPLAPKAAYAAAWVLINKLDMKSEGIEEYRRIVKEYPYTSYADGSRRILGMESLGLMMHGPPIPKGWSPPDSAKFAAALQAVSAGSAADTSVTAAPDTSVTGARPDSTRAGVPPDSSPVPARPDSTGAGEMASDSSGVPARPDSTGAGQMAPDSSGVPARPDSTGVGQMAPDTGSAGGTGRRGGGS